MCTGGFGRRSLSRPTDLVLLSSTIVRGASCTGSYGLQLAGFYVDHLAY